MFNYHHNNYVQLGFNNIPYQKRTDYTDRASIHISEKAKYIPTSFRDELVRSAKLVYEDHGKVNLCLSGGVDSQCMLYAFLEAGVPFDIVIWKIANNYNDIDVNKAITLCDSLNLDYSIVEKDLVKWLQSNEFIHAIKKIKHGWFGITSRLPFFLHNYDKPIISAMCDFGNAMYDLSGESSITRGTIQNIIYHYDLKFITAFFQYTPELVLAQLTPNILKAYNNYTAEYIPRFRKEDIFFPISEKIAKAILDEGSDRKLIKFYLYDDAFPEISIPKKFNGIDTFIEHNQELWQTSKHIVRSFSDMEDNEAKALNIPQQFDGERMEGHNYLRANLLPSSVS